MQMQLYGFPNSLEASVHFDFTQFTHTIDYYFSHCDSEREPYFYHPDHLGSASWITDTNGYPVQHLQYLPFGEPFVNQRATNYNERYTFTGKERDSETGYSYFGARYYDSDLSGLFLSVDPMAEVSSFEKKVGAATHVVISTRSTGACTILCVESAEAG